MARTNIEGRFFDMNKQAILAVAFLSATLLVSCGGDDPPPPPGTAPATAKVQVNPATVSAVNDLPFEFDAVPEFGTTGTTTVAFKSATGAGSPTFTIVSEGFAATGITAFGSCTFIVGTASTFPAGHPLAPGSSIRFDPCEIEFLLNNMPANGIVLPTTSTLRLAARISRGRPLSVRVLPNGEVQVNGITVGIVTVSPGTGAAGG